MLGVPGWIYLYHTFITTVVERFNNILLSKNNKLHNVCRVWPCLGVKDVGIKRCLEDILFQQQ